MANAMRFAPDKLRDAVVGKNWSKFVERFAEAFDACTPEGDPDHRARGQAQALYAQISGMVGPQSQIIVQLNASLGVRDEAELRELVDAGRRYREAESNATITAQDLWPKAAQALLLCAPRMARSEVESLAQRLMAMIGTDHGDGAPSENGAEHG